MNLPALSRHPDLGSTRSTRNPAVATPGVAIRSREGASPATAPDPVLTPADAVELADPGLRNALINSGLLDDLRASAAGTDAALSAFVTRVTGDVLGASSQTGATSVMVDYRASLSVLMAASTEALPDFLSAVDAFLSDDQVDALSAFLSDLAARLTGRTTEGAADEAFRAAMDRLGSVREISVKVSAEAQVRVAAQSQKAPKEADPLVLDLAGDGINLTGAERGTAFDIDANGETERVSFVQGDDAFLALDRNGNGRVDDGRELFGDQNGAANGFEELARYDGNADGRIDRADPVYVRLRVLQDLNGDGTADPTELRRLDEAGVASIQLSYSQMGGRLASGDRVVQQGTFTRLNGGTGVAADAMVRFLDLTA